MRINSILSLSILVAATSLAAADPQIVRLSDAKWAQPFGPKGPAFSFVEGKLGDANPASFYVKLPAGGDSGWHTHDEQYQGVVVQGRFTEQQTAESKETELALGTYFTQPGKIVHRNGCLGTQDCIVYVHFAKNANSTPTTRDGKPVQMK
jgi:quercetin dioxygenase-like cupin family protein|nr:DUF4437 domain-containing protein [Kofleriaceae bacterium]